MAEQEEELIMETEEWGKGKSEVNGEGKRKDSKAGKREGNREMSADQNTNSIKAV